MLDQAILEKVVLNIAEINNLMRKFDFNEISIFKPTSSLDAKKVNFVAKPIADSESIDLFKLAQIDEELSEKLGCEVTFLPENRMSDNFREIIMSNKVLLAENNEKEIRIFFEKNLISRKESNQAGTAFSGTMWNAGSDRENTHQDTEVEKLKKVKQLLESNPEIAEYIRTIPDVFEKLKKECQNICVNSGSNLY